MIRAHERAFLRAAVLLTMALSCASCEVRGGSGLRVVGPSTLIQENRQKDQVREQRDRLVKLRRSRDPDAGELLRNELNDLASWWEHHLAEERRRAADPEGAEMPSWEERNEALCWLSNGCEVIEGVADRGLRDSAATLFRILETGRADGDVVILNCAVRALGDLGDAAALPVLRRYLVESVKGTDPAYAAVSNPYNREALKEAVKALEAEGR